MSKTRTTTTAKPPISVASQRKEPFTGVLKTECSQFIVRVCDQAGIGSQTTAATQ